MPEFSVVTIVKDRRKQLANLLDSIRRATLQPVDIQIVCMDDTDGIVIPAHLDVTLHRLASNDTLPLAAARNKGIESARTDTVIFIDVDCIVSPTLFASMLVRLTEQLIITAYPLYLSAVPDNGDFAQLQAAGLAHPARQKLPADIPVPHLQFWSLIFAVQRPTFYRIGGFDEAFTGYGAEDTDFAMSFHKAGIEQIFVRDYVLHQYHSKYNPPLNHFDAIIQNATTYRNKWGDYPMQKWLTAFADMGLITIKDGRTISILRRPTTAEIDDSISNKPY